MTTSQNSEDAKRENVRHHNIPDPLHRYDWRIQPHPDQAAREVACQLSARWSDGMDLYGPYFNQDPFDHGDEEAHDTIHYLRAGRRERDAYLLALTDIRDIIAEGGDHALSLSEIRRITTLALSQRERQEQTNRQSHSTEPIAHAEDCNQVRTARDEEQYLAGYPGVCRNCLGTGQTVQYKTHGSTHGPTEAIPDICGCLDSGHCPRCGASVQTVQTDAADYFRCVGDHKPNSLAPELPTDTGCGWTDSPDSPAPKPAPVGLPDAWRTCTCEAGQNQ